MTEVVNSKPATVCVPKLVTITEGVKEGRHVDSPTLPRPATVKSRSVTAMPPKLSKRLEREDSKHARMRSRCPAVNMFLHVSWA